VSDELVALSGAAPRVGIGEAVEVVAAVSLYRNTPQLVPASTGDIVVLDGEVSIAAERFVGELSEGDVGRWVAVRGAVTEVDPFSAGVKLTLDDGSGRLTLLLWQDVYDGLRDGVELGAGAEVRAQGEVAEYRGELELIPELPEDVEVLAGASSRAGITAIGTLTMEDVGRWVTLAGAMGPAEPFSAGVKFALDDGTGRITLLIWDDVYQEAPPGLGEGAEIVVTGQVGEYRGDLEIIPEADGVRVGD
jgi:DNA/RNA endonuclease YhcR with UshA esterase domain